VKIVVCIKQVPDTTEVKIDPQTGTLIRKGIPTIINPDDKSGLEVALKLKDKYKAHITVLTMGPAQAEVALRETLAMGADEAILLSDRKFAGADTWATSCTLAAAINNLEYDLIICGRQAIDGDTAQVGPQIAEHLQLPQVSYVENLEYVDGRFILKRMFEDRYQKIAVTAPCLITTLKEIAEPRYMSVAGVFDAYEKEIKQWSLQDITIAEKNLGLKGSPTRVKATQTKGAKSAGKVHEVSAAEGAKIIVDKLKEKYIV